MNTHTHTPWFRHRKMIGLYICKPHQTELYIERIMLKLFNFLRNFSSVYYKNPLVPRFYRFVEYAIACISLNELFLLWCIILRKISHLICFHRNFFNSYYAEHSRHFLLLSSFYSQNTFVLHFSNFSMHFLFILFLILYIYNHLLSRFLWIAATLLASYISLIAIWSWSLVLGWRLICFILFPFDLGPCFI